MKKFQHWLDKNRGMATTLRKRLGINATNVSNAKSGRKKIPPAWFKHIVSLSNGRITYEELTLSRED